MEKEPNELKDELGHEYRANYIQEGDLATEGWIEDGLSLHEDALDSLRLGVSHRKRDLALKEPVRSPIQSTKIIWSPKKRAKTKMTQWSNEKLELAIKGLDQGYKMFQMYTKYEIPQSSLRDHLVESLKGRKMGPKIVLSMDEERKLIDYIHLIFH